MDIVATSPYFEIMTAAGSRSCDSDDEKKNYRIQNYWRKQRYIWGSWKAENWKNLETEWRASSEFKTPYLGIFCFSKDRKYQTNLNAQTQHQNVYNESGEVDTEMMMKKLRNLLWISMSMVMNISQGEVLGNPCFEGQSLNCLGTKQTPEVSLNCTYMFLGEGIYIWRFANDNKSLPQELYSCLSYLYSISITPFCDNCF